MCGDISCRGEDAFDDAWRPWVCLHITADRNSVSMGFFSKMDVNYRHRVRRYNVLCRKSRDITWVLGFVVVCVVTCTVHTKWQWYAYIYREIDIDFYIDISYSVWGTLCHGTIALIDRSIDIVLSFLGISILLYITVYRVMGVNARPDCFQTRFRLRLMCLFCRCLLWRWWCTARTLEQNDTVLARGMLKLRQRGKMSDLQKLFGMCILVDSSLALLNAHAMTTAMTTANSMPRLELWDATLDVEKACVCVCVLSDTVRIGWMWYRFYDIYIYIYIFVYRVSYYRSSETTGSLHHRRRPMRKMATLAAVEKAFHFNVESYHGGHTTLGLIVTLAHLVLVRDGFRRFFVAVALHFVWRAFLAFHQWLETIQSKRLSWSHRFVLTRGGEPLAAYLYRQWCMTRALIWYPLFPDTIPLECNDVNLIEPNQVARSKNKWQLHALIFVDHLFFYFATFSYWPAARHNKIRTTDDGRLCINWVRRLRCWKV